MYNYIYYAVGVILMIKVFLITYYCWILDQRRNRTREAAAAAQSSMMGTLQPQNHSDQIAIVGQAAPMDISPPPYPYPTHPLPPSAQEQSTGRPTPRLHNPYDDPMIVP
ncbi:hypothetical protein ACOMHN_007064 [Nucella lapillus]